jgi:hypothetical protein
MRVMEYGWRSVHALLVKACIATTTEWQTYLMGWHSLVCAAPSELFLHLRSNLYLRRRNNTSGLRLCACSFALPDSQLQRLNTVCKNRAWAIRMAWLQALRHLFAKSAKLLPALWLVMWYTGYCTRPASVIIRYTIAR